MAAIRTLCELTWLQASAAVFRTAASSAGSLGRLGLLDAISSNMVAFFINSVGVTVTSVSPNCSISNGHAQFAVWSQYR